MSTLSQLKHGLSRLLDNLAEGWHELSEKTGHALTHFSPKSSGDRLETAEDQFLNSTPRWGLLAAELSEDDDDVTVSLEIPGMAPENFDIEVIDDYVVIRGEKRLERSRKEGRYHLTECAYGSFERALPLPAAVDVSRCKARYHRGVLRVQLPKREAFKTRRIEVQAG